MELQISDLGKQYLNGKYEPSNFVSIHDCWFLNNSDGKFKINFLRKSLVHQYKVAVIKDKHEINKRNIEKKDLSIFEKWDSLLINLFNIRYVLERTPTGFMIYSKDPEESEFNSDTSKQGVHDQLNPDRKTQSDEFTKMEITKLGSSESAEKIENAIPPENQKAPNLKLQNKKLTITQAFDRLECSACRLAVIYILASSYINKTTQYVRQITDKQDYSQIKHNYLKRKILEFKENKNSRKAYAEMQDWKLRYLFRMPLRRDRVIELYNMWKDLYAFFDIESSIAEMENKLKEFALDKKEKKLERLNKRMRGFSYAATFAATASCIILALSKYIPILWAILLFVFLYVLKVICDKISETWFDS